MAANPSRGLVLVASLGAVLLTLLCYGRILGYGLTDFDTPAYVVENTVRGLGEVPEQLTKELVGGRAGQVGRFYRPTVNLLYAGLATAFGWPPLAYHAAALVLHAANGLLLALFAARFAGRLAAARPQLFGLLCAVLFLVHPLGEENVPGNARLGELLAVTLFLGAMLLLDRLEARRAAGGGAPWRWLVAFYLLYGLALGTKESGVVLAGAAFLYVVWVRRDLAPLGRLRHGALLVTPCVVITLGFLAARAAVLGEILGGYGYERAPLTIAIRLAVGMSVETALPGYAHDLLYRAGHAATDTYLSAFAPWPRLGLVLAMLGVLAAALGVVILALRTDEKGAASSEYGLVRLLQRPLGRAVSFALLVLLAYAALMWLANFYTRRNLYPVCVFWSFLPASVGVWAASALGALRTQARGHGAMFQVAGLSLFAGWGALFLWQSPLLHRYDDWRSAGQASRLLMQDLRPQWERLPDRATVHLVNLPLTITTDPMRLPWFRHFSTTYAVADYSLQAWLDAVLPEKGIRVRPLGQRDFREPVEGFRHEATLCGGWLLFAVPEGYARKTRPGVADPAFRWAEVGERRGAITYGDRPVPRNHYVLVFDGWEPLLIGVDDMSGHGTAPPPHCLGAFGDV